MPIIVGPLTTSRTWVSGDIIRNALSILKVAGQDTTLDGGDAQAGLDFLNMMLDGWGTQNLTIYQIVRETFALTSGHNPHTWGVGGDFNSVRPIEIMAATIHLSAGAVDLPLGIVSYDVYEAQRIKQLVVNFPQYVYIDNGFPLSNCWFWPVPNGASVNFQSYKALSQFISINDVISLPPGYLRAMSYNLAIELASVYNIDPPMLAVRIAEQSLRDLKRMNFKPTLAQFDPALIAMSGNGGRYDPYSDLRR